MLCVFVYGRNLAVKKRTFSRCDSQTHFMSVSDVSVFAFARCVVANLINYLCSYQVSIN